MMLEAKLKELPGDVASYFDMFKHEWINCIWLSEEGVYEQINDVFDEHDIDLTDEQEKLLISLI